MVVNGKPLAHRDGLTLHALLDALRVDRQGVVVMQGEEIHRAGAIPDAPVMESDVIEIITMMQGG